MTSANDIDDLKESLKVGKSSKASSTCLAYRIPIGGGFKTQSKGGIPVAPLMGEQRRFDGGVSHFLLRPFVTLMALNDHAILFQFLPLAAESTDVVITWLVDAAARDVDIDIERMVWLWDVTTVQDKRLIERNAAGVRSRSYTPGPYSKLESNTAEFVNHYLQEQSMVMANGQQQGNVTQSNSVAIRQQGESQ